MDELLRIYDPESECGEDGYPRVWHKGLQIGSGEFSLLPIKHLVREQAGHRCERCGHPYPPGIAGEHPRGEWTPCDEHCTHDLREGTILSDALWNEERIQARREGRGEAQWRILTVHHLNGVKYDCRWWNLAALCQRCHLTIQGKVVMERVYPFEHSEWFKPHAAGWYAADYLGEELSREQVMARLDELLALEQQLPQPIVYDPTVKLPGFLPS